MKPRHPGEKQEKHDVGADHLGLLRPRERGPEGHPQCCRGDVDAQNAEQADQQGPRGIEEPEGEGDLLGGQEGKADEGRVDVDLQLVEAREKSDLGEIRPRQDQRRNRRDGRVVEAQSVEQVQADRDQQAGDQVTVGEELPQPVIVEALLHQDRYPQQREVHALVAQGLTAQEADGAYHHEVAHQDEADPAEQRTGPGPPRDLLQHLHPAHLPGALQPVVEAVDRLYALGVPVRGQQGLQHLGPAVLRRGEVKRDGQVEKKGAGEPGPGDSGQEHHQGPRHEQLPAGEQPVLFEHRPQQRRQDHHPHQDVERRQREVPAPQRRALAVGVVEGRDGADQKGQQDPQDHGSQADPLPGAVPSLGCFRFRVDVGHLVSVPPRVHAGASDVLSGAEPTAPSAASPCCSRTSASSRS